MVNNFLITLNNLQQMRLKLLQKTAEPTCDLIGNKIADKITGASKMSPKNNLETNEEEILKEKYISPESKKKTIINDLD